MKKYKNLSIFKYAIVVSSLIPSISLAALDGVKGLLVSFRGILGLLVPILFGLSLIYFFWGTSQFILHSGDQKTRDEGKKKMLWGIIALFVFVSIYGILSFIGKSLDIAPGGDMSDIFNLPR